ncbi:hypothetical protein MUCCIDRAFT_85556 [Mucor lusitanicus CBS 277.49]|uniref:Uncharacterized protein n=1 Tax=Mucor lusitanicus CBS 277.49 TaxID=747725 RepID=A0A168JKC4_MUCCL|nr:hypothetical protein MUCCIDRAFT_85556 [Mucor lusitanicus CBS 277.49]
MAPLAYSCIVIMLSIAALRKRLQDPEQKSCSTEGDAARPDTIIALPQHAAVKAAQPQTARPEPPQRIALSQAHQEQQAPDLTDEEVIEETTRRGWHSDDIGLGQSRQAWLDYARHGNPAFIRRRPDWSLWVVELYIRNNHPDDDINPDFIEDLEDVDQD